jgi:hypothetical protein
MSWAQYFRQYKAYEAFRQDMSDFLNGHISTRPVRDIRHRVSAIIKYLTGSTVIHHHLEKRGCTLLSKPGTMTGEQYELPISNTPYSPIQRGSVSNAYGNCRLIYASKSKVSFVVRSSCGQTCEARTLRHAVQHHR